MRESTCLLVEDHPGTSLLLKNVIASAFPGISTKITSTVREAKTWIDDRKKSNEQRKFKLALVDLGLPDGSGIEVIEHLKVSDPETKIIVVSIYDEDAYLFQALSAGASGYLLKDETPEALTELLKRVSSDEPALSPAIARRLLSFFQTPRVSNAENKDLSPREKETLTLISRGLTVPEAASHMGLRPQTVAGYVKIIYQKLHVSNRVELIREASRRGLV